MFTKGHIISEARGVKFSGNLSAIEHLHLFFHEKIDKHYQAVPSKVTAMIRENSGISNVIKQILISGVNINKHFIWACVCAKVIQMFGIPDLPQL